MDWQAQSGETPNVMNRIHAESEQHINSCARPRLFHARSEHSTLESRMSTTEIIWPAAAAVDPMIVWGAANIAPHIGKTTKGAFSVLESGRVPGAKKIAGRWALNLRVFHASFETSVAA
jgi:hypothetical protein